MKTKNLLLIFTRNPELGKVKSRLAKDVGDLTALNIYKDLLAHTKHIAQQTNADRFVFYTERIEENDLWPTSDFNKFVQSHGDLGQKMKNAFEFGFQSGYENIIVIGSDILELNETIINTAFDLLENKDAVIGPAEDGGYYLLGLTKMIPDLFENKLWGTDSVFNSTTSDLDKLNQNYTLLEVLNDIDYVTDIKDSNMILKYNLESYNKEKTC
ncbi:MAG: TIGR04282 family arsenosugar biosynthesis glycosyltransferase [Flavobacteriales bacterium]